jgi:hypothetical protein
VPFVAMDVTVTPVPMIVAAVTTLVEESITEEIEVKVEFDPGTLAR